MSREVKDDEGTTWTCAQAGAGASDADSDGRSERYRVVCTPSGGARPVELELPGDWEKALADGDLLAGIQDQVRMRGGS
jgi:hypothetical protein